ncbi:MAG: hypothetical protein ACKO42_05920 [Gammaproteobacteria bacterium]
MDHTLPQIADPIPLAASPETGRRPESPQFTDDPMLDRLYGVTLALVAELAVTRTRLDALERVLARREVVGSSEVDDFVPQAFDATARGRLQSEYLARVLRALD